MKTTLSLAPVTLEQAVAAYPYPLTLVDGPCPYGPENLRAYPIHGTENTHPAQRFTQKATFAYDYPGTLDQDPKYGNPPMKGAHAIFVFDELNARWVLGAD